MDTTMDAGISESVCRQDLTNAVIHILGLLKMMENYLATPLDRLPPRDHEAAKFAYDFARYWSDVAEAEMVRTQGSNEQLRAMFTALSYLGEPRN